MSCYRCGNRLRPWSNVIAAPEGNAHWGYTKFDKDADELIWRCGKDERR